ncbi:efflux RND transporter permease subunit [Neptunicella marina]|uniref:MMPL family transporter n=1 Tax=Neptunicella marina TaxID=2125989 RepID=A0A8J6M461_9ALTE|nr:efflux RND transporter permease subunit [Neptunicella marina]MBC3767692.1 MMPL family transporter [Neptunicella marina]
MSSKLVKLNKIILLVFAVMVVVLGYFTQQFRIDASADTLLVKDNKLFIQTQVMNKRFSPQEFILVAYQPTKGELFSQQTFDDIQALSKKFSAMPRVQSVTSMLNVPLLSFMQGLNTDVDADSWTWEKQHYSSAQMQKVFTDHPIYSDLLVNKQQTATAIQIVFKPDPQLKKFEDEKTDIQQTLLNGELSEQQQQRIEQLNQLIDPIKQQLDKQRRKEIDQIYAIAKEVKDHAHVYLGGGHVLAYQLIKIIQSDLMLFGSAIAAVICILLFILFRQLRWVVLPLLCCGVSVIMTVGLFGMLDLRTTVISSNFIALQLILTLAIVIHLIVQFRQSAQANPEHSQYQLVTDTIKAKAKPCFYAALTTSVGFASLIFSNIQPVISFGWMMIVAMLVSTLVALLLFPAVLSLLSKKPQSHVSRRVEATMEALANTVLANKGKVFVAGLLVLMVSVLGILRLNVENSFIHYFSEDTKVRTELEFIDQKFGGTTALDVVFKVPDTQKLQDLVLSAQTVQTLQKLQQVLRQYPVVGKEMSVVNFTELASKINNNKPLTEYELTAVYHMLDKNLTERLLGAYFDKEHHELRINTRIKDATDGFNRAEFIQQLQSDLQQQGVAKQDIQLTNLFVLYQDILQRLFDSQISTLGLVYVALTLVLFAIFRSVKVAMIAVLPNILSTLVILGVMGLAGISLDLMTITIAAIAMGIAVDDTIHFVHHYLSDNQQQDHQKALHKAYQSVGFAMLFTSLIIALGFGMLGFSDFIPSVMFGLLTGLAMVVALVTDLTLLPALLGRFAKNKTA